MMDTIKQVALMYAVVGVFVSALVPITVPRAGAVWGGKQVFGAKLLLVRLIDGIVFFRPPPR